MTSASSPEQRANEDFEIRRLSPEHDEARDDFVRAHPRGTVFHQSNWRRTVNRVFHHAGWDYGAWRDDELVGVLPMMRIKALPRGENLISMPYAVYGGALGQTPAVTEALLREGMAEARRLRVGRLELRSIDSAPPALGLVESDLYSTFVKQLPQTPDEVLAGMPKKSRAEARKARNKHRLQLVEGRWYVEDLARLFTLNKRQLGSPSLPADFFRTLLEELGDRVVVHLVVRDREPLMGIMSFLDGDTLIAYYSGTAPDADRNFSASNFAYMALQEWSVEQGFRVFDFCRSRRDSGAYSFKLHQGFEAIPLHYSYCLVTKQGLPALTPSNPRTALLRRTWSRLPLPVVQRLSPMLARYLA
ncbi:FemAB family XrtA/PEP-CTERM system-associated protein [Engelhardtia mirabilis]|uniref:BioF2-like acetyltransferase domain-containing protein n=1 Tax=Engelhardtia mirabilis TaxID=2528011 RepID=A0A518BKD4_9BACT|nr:hypothetical protein Pla133_25200 [Planctomycetes bacterium Pla133]QDV01763.1 hypothetical protein Pla86_25190 [Planctomycetes bacterium Pla86]